MVSLQRDERRERERAAERERVLPRDEHARPERGEQQRRQPRGLAPLPQHRRGEQPGPRDDRDHGDREVADERRERVVERAVVDQLVAARVPVVVPDAPAVGRERGRQVLVRGTVHAGRPEGREREGERQRHAERDRHVGRHAHGRRVWPHVRAGRFRGSAWAQRARTRGRCLRPWGSLGEERGYQPVPSVSPPDPRTTSPVKPVRRAVASSRARARGESGCAAMRVRADEISPSSTSSSLTHST